MERPARVRILKRNPCFFARRRLFGWKVRFDMVGLPERRGGVASLRPATPQRYGPDPIPVKLRAYPSPHDVLGSVHPGSARARRDTEPEAAPEPHRSPVSAAMHPRNVGRTPDTWAPRAMVSGKDRAIPVTGERDTPKRSPSSRKKWGSALTRPGLLRLRSHRTGGEIFAASRRWGRVLRRLYPQPVNTVVNRYSPAGYREGL